MSFYCQALVSIMAGHSHFANIKHKKERNDAKKAKLFTKVQRQIIVALKNGLPDPTINTKLYHAIMEARSYNLPKDRIDNIIKKYQGNAEGGDDYQDVRYNGYAIGGISVIVECLTDNKNRSAGEVRAAFTKYSGALGETGSVEFNFDHIGLIIYPKSIQSYDKILELSLEAEASDIDQDDEFYYITTEFSSMHKVYSELKKSLGEATETKIIWQPKESTTIEDQEKIEKFNKLIDTLEDLDDVQNVYHNANI